MGVLGYIVSLFYVFVCRGKDKKDDSIIFYFINIFICLFIYFRN